MGLMMRRSVHVGIWSVGVLCIGGVPTADADESSPHACELAAPHDPQAHPAPVDCAFGEDTGYVQGGAFTITVFHIDGEPVEVNSGNAFHVMREAAAADGVDIHIVSGFRTMSEQQYLYACYVNCNCNNCNLAATPGYSNHQSGHAFDVNTTGYGGSVYNWLNANGASFGFANTVAGEHWHWEWWEGGPGGGVCLVNSPPQGSFDAAACEGIEGWAQDPDQPGVATNAHLSFDGPVGDENATSVSLAANEARPDLCDVLAGDCDHGFSMHMPMSLRNGVEHSVFAYADDLEGELDALLFEHPFNCAPPELVGALREVDAAAFAAWQFDPFLDMAPVDAASIDPIPVWLPLEDTPRLIQVEGQPEVWLVDAGMRRHVPDPKVARTWHFDLGTVEVVDEKTLQALPEWEPVREMPLLVTAADGTIYLVDETTIDEGDDTDGGSSGGGGGGSGSDSVGDGDTHDTDDTHSSDATGGETDGGPALPGADGDGSGGCSTSGRGRGWVPLLVLLSVVRFRRRRRASLDV